MGWLDPHECKVAAEYLRQGQTAEAARVLLASKHPQHKAVVQLKLQAGRELVAQARQLAEQQQWQAAQEQIELAARCQKLDGEARHLQLIIQQALRKEQQLRHWKKEKLQQARRQLDQGHLHTALEMVQAAGSTTTASPLRQEIQERMERFRRYLAQCRQALDRKDPQAAYHYWKQARRLCVHDDQLEALARQIVPQLAAIPVPHSPVPATGRGRFLLGQLALVVPQAQVCLGTPRSSDVDVPLLGPLRSRHALLFCDRAGWSVTACRNPQRKFCPAWLNGEPVRGSAGLQDGDRLALGNPEQGWTFRQPVPGSATAVLDPLLQNAPTLAILGAQQSTCVVLLRDRLVLAPQAPAHVVLPELPCPQVELRLSHQGLLVETQEGISWWETPSGIVSQPEQAIWPPARLVVEAELDEAQRLGQVAAGGTDAALLELELKLV